MSNYVKRGGKRLSHKKFAESVAKKVGGASSASIAQKYIDAIVECLIDELKISGSCKIKYLGIFKLRHIKSRKMIVPMPTGGSDEKWIEEGYSATFVPSRTFKTLINDKCESLRTRRLEKLALKRKAVAEVKQAKDKMILDEKIEAYKGEVLKERPRKNG